MAKMSADHISSSVLVSPEAASGGEAIQAGHTESIDSESSSMFVL